MTIVYVLMHIHEFDSEREDIKTIGAYSSRENAEKAIERLKLAPGFRDTSGGFMISELPLDKDHWIDGYATV